MTSPPLRSRRHGEAADAAVDADPGQVAQTRALGGRAPQRYLHQAGFHQVEPVEDGGDLRVAA